MATVESVNISRRKGERKNPAGKGQLVDGHGLAGDAHADGGRRQLSLLALESIEKMRAKGLDVLPGDFAENITTAGIDLVKMPIGSRLRLGEAVVELTQLGKECEAPCEIYHQAGDCVMPREGVFAVVILSGTVSAGDSLEKVG
jgi:MOSC domain-containing protein YiiM